MINEWEGAELCYYCNGESNAIALSDTQFAIIVKILGLEINADESVNCFSDKTLKFLATIDNHPLKMKRDIE